METCKLLWKIGSAILMAVGVAHFFGTLYSKLMHPKVRNTRDVMEKSTLQVDDKVSVWEAWLGFNVVFSICVFLLGFVNFYLAMNLYTQLKGFSVWSITLLLGLILLVVMTHYFKIRKVRTAFLVPFMLYLPSLFIEVLY